MSNFDNGLFDHYEPRRPYHTNGRYTLVVRLLDCLGSADTCIQNFALLIKACANVQEHEESGFLSLA